MKELQKVTILLATFNRAQLISETLDSIVNQTYSNWECIIVDDYSTDTTVEVVSKYLEKDGRFSYYLKTDKYQKGLSGTRNYGLDIAASRNADFIQFFDDDDIMHPRKLELQIKPFLNDNSLSFTICKYRHYYESENLKFGLEDEDCDIVSQNLFRDFFVGRMAINSLGPLWKGQLILRYRFDEELVFGEERDLYLKIFLKDRPKYKSINYVLFYYRKHLLSNTGDRYRVNDKRLALYKMELNLYEFVKKNSLWNHFLLKEMSYRFIYKNFDLGICNELLDVIEKEGFDKLLKGKVLRIQIRSQLLLRKFLVSVFRKI